MNINVKYIFSNNFIIWTMFFFQHKNKEKYATTSGYNNKQLNMCFLLKHNIGDCAVHFDGLYQASVKAHSCKGARMCTGKKKKMNEKQQENICVTWLHTIGDCVATQSPNSKCSVFKLAVGFQDDRDLELLTRFCGSPGRMFQCGKLVSFDPKIN